MIFTGIVFSIASSGDFATNARMNAVRERRQNLRRDAAADEDTAGCDRAQRDVSGFGAVGLDEDVERVDAPGAGAIERGARDRGRCIGRLEIDRRAAWLLAIRDDMNIDEPSS